MYKGQEFQGKIERLSEVIEITMAEYSELTPEEIANGYFYIPDYDGVGGYSGKAVSMLGDIYVPEQQGGD